MAGNFSESYSNGINEKLFNVNNRYSLKKIIESSKFFKKLDLKDEIDFFNNLTDDSIFLIDRLSEYQVSQDKLFYFLSKFNFFFALPGLYMPICHNIIEAMSVGTIPFLQKGYANAFQPQLKNGVNCITFKGTEDLFERIEFLFSLDPNTIIKLQDGVKQFYMDNLSSKKIVFNLVNNNYSRIYLMAEEYSVKQLSLKLGSKLN